VTVSSDIDFERAWQVARDTWPGLDIALPVFTAHLVTRAGGAEISTLAITDLYVACCCAHEIPGAREILAAAFLTDVGLYVRRIDSSEEFADEVRQRVAERLLAGGRIGEYTGRGPLGAWIRVTTVRIALDLRAAAHRQESLGNAVLEASGGDPELEYLRARYLPVFAEAVREALAALPAKQRTLLRLHHVAGLTTDQIGTLHKVHQSTAVRWLQAARGAVLDAVRSRLEVELGVTSAEMRSLAGVLVSGLDMSIERVLRESD